MRTTARRSIERTLRRTVGIRDAKARLSELLRDAQLGHEWTVTERGKPIARIVPIDGTTASFEERLLRLEKNGVIELTRDLARRMLDEVRGG